jgi:hypothetical protein
MRISADVVVPTAGRPSLALLLASLDGPPDRLPGRVIVVDDRREPGAPLETGALSSELAARLDVVSSGGRGPAAARNRGWQASRAEWVAFLDDDVVPCRGWLTELARDLDALPRDVGGSLGALSVPLPFGRRPTDHERDVHARAHARWTSANGAFRTRALRRAGGFDERFSVAQRADADLVVRLRAAGYRVVDGRRQVVRALWPADAWASIGAQAGHADDALMRAVHGREWRTTAHAPASDLSGHAVVTVAALSAIVAASAGHAQLATAGLVAWLIGTGLLAWTRIVPGPRTAPEIATVLATSACIPPVALWHRMAGALRVARAHDLPRLDGAGRDALGADRRRADDIRDDGDDTRSGIRLPADVSRVDAVATTPGIARDRIEAGDAFLGAHS